MMPGRLVAGLWTLNPGYGRSNRSPAASSLTILKFPLRPMSGTLRSERGNRGSSPREGAGAMVYRQDG